MKVMTSSKEEILQKSRELIATEGLQSFNIRSLAKKCDLSIGSIYNYFENKTEILTETIAYVWCDILNISHISDQPSNFLQEVETLFANLEKGNEKYPDFISFHSMSFFHHGKQEAQNQMEAAWKELKKYLYDILCQDDQISQSAFHASFTPEQLIDLIFSSLLSSILTHDFDCTGLLYVLKKVLYA